MPELSFFISDLHMGINGPENLYQARYHEAGLKAVLRHLTASARDTRDLVILGDWFDMLASPPDRRPYALPEVVAANPGVFEEKKDGSGDFISLLRKVRGRVCFVNGNHDQFVSLADINAILEPRCGRRIEGSPDPVRNSEFRAGDILAEHGHMHSLFFRATTHVSRADPPFGTFITRLLARICARELAKSGKTCAPELRGAGEPVFGIEAAAFALKELVELALGQEDLAQAVLDQTLFLAGARREDASFVLDDGSVLEAGAIPTKYRDLWTGHDEDLEPLVVDATNSLKKAAEERIASGARIVAMGHTHRPLLHVERYPAQALYVNSGFCCPTLDGLESGERFPTFVEIRHRARSDVVMLRKVDRAGRISTLEAAEVKRRK